MADRTGFEQVLDETSEDVRFSTAIHALSRTQRRTVLSFLYKEKFLTPSDLTKLVNKRLEDHPLNRSDVDY